MALRVRMQGEKQVIEGEITELKFYLCEFNPSRRNATKHFIIQPCTISLHGNTPETNGMNISLSASDIRINISPGNYHIYIYIHNRIIILIKIFNTIRDFNSHNRNC